jgi:hypothetical protein
VTLGTYKVAGEMSRQEQMRGHLQMLHFILRLIFPQGRCQVTGISRRHVHVCAIIHLKILLVHPNDGALGSAMVKALCYKPEGRGFDIR